jgi:hypothetical protein
LAFSTADGGTDLAFFEAAGHSVCLARVGSVVVVHDAGQIFAETATVGAALATLRRKLPELRRRSKLNRDGSVRGPR